MGYLCFSKQVSPLPKDTASQIKICFLSIHQTVDFDQFCHHWFKWPRDQVKATSVVDKLLTCFSSDLVVAFVSERKKKILMVVMPCFMNSSILKIFALQLKISVLISPQRNFAKRGWCHFSVWILCQILSKQGFFPPQFFKQMIFCPSDADSFLGRSLDVMSSTCQVFFSPSKFPGEFEHFANPVEKDTAVWSHSFRTNNTWLY